MVSKGEVSNDFRKQVLGYGLTTAEIVYRRPDRHWLHGCDCEPASHRAPLDPALDFQVAISE
jgi:hypothetical protein